MSDREHLTAWREIDPPRTVVTMRLEITDAELVAADFSQFRTVMVLGRRSSVTAADQLLVLEAIVRAREVHTGSDLGSTPTSPDAEKS